MKLFKLVLLLLIISTIVFISCQKTGIQSELKAEAGLSTESKFFTSHRSADADENAIVEFIKRKNSKKSFVEATVKQIGLPRWDKISKTKTGRVIHTVKSDGVRTNSSTVQQGDYYTYYIPFVRDSQNYVNASMIIKTSPTDTTIGYICDWQYQRVPNNYNQITDDAEYLAVFLMVLDNWVFGHTKFKIIDKNLFKSNQQMPLEITLNTTLSNSGSMTFLTGVQHCTNISITSSLCTCTSGSTGRCWGPGGSCDHCGSVECPPDGSTTFNYCWTEWLDEGGGPASGPGGESGGGGSGGTGGDVPPPPCGLGPVTIDGKASQNNLGVTTYTTPCGGAGWRPIDDLAAPFIWEFTGDDGSTFVDADPTKEVDLQFDPNDHIDTQYPNLYQLVKNLKDFVKSSPEVMASLMIWSGYTKQQILDKLTFGKGPTVKVVEGLDSYSRYNKATGVNVLLMNANWVRGLEAAVLPATKRGTAFMIAVSLLHEFVHFGTGQHNVNEGKMDFGWGFERTAFNIIVDENNANEVSIKFNKLP